MTETLKKGGPGISHAHVKSTVATLDKIETKMATLRGDKAAVLALAVDRGINKQALKEARKIKNMEAAVGRDYTIMVDIYKDILGVNDQFDMLDPVDGQPTQEVEDDGKEERVAELVDSGEEGAQVQPGPESAEVQTGEGDGSEVADALDIAAIEEVGKKACRDGKKQGDNPYDSDEEGEQYSAWGDGWAISFNKGEFPTVRAADDAEAEALDPETEKADVA